MRAGREKSVAATKTYTGQLMALYLLAWALGAKLRIEDLESLPDLAATALELESEVSALAERYRFMHHAVVVGRGLNYSNAFEFALKMMETSYVVAERFSSADFLHGPIAMVDPNFPVFLLAPSGPTWPSMNEMLAKMAGLKAETVVITDRRNAPALRLAPHRVITVPQLLPSFIRLFPTLFRPQVRGGARAGEKSRSLSPPDAE